MRGTPKIISGAPRYDRHREESPGSLAQILHSGEACMAEDYENSAKTTAELSSPGAAKNAL
jgi:hypothetical protein